MQEFLDRTSNRLPFSAADRDAIVPALLEVQNRAQIEDEANTVLRNEFELLGSGPLLLGREIDWHCDFKTGLRWRTDFYADIDYVNEGQPSDVKVPWELARFHHLSWLGKAFWLTGCPAYAEKSIRDVSRWIELNPCPYGIHWANAMEAAIRSWNWCLALAFFGRSGAIAEADWFGVIKSLYEHGDFIRHNLECGRRANNHYIADGFGLLLLGVLFRETNSGVEWARTGSRILEQEIRAQTYDDGVNYEQSTSYHRFVLELLTTAYLIGCRNGITFSPGYRDGLCRMFDFVAAYTRPDGLAPVIGDADDGRLSRWSASEDLNDHRGALAVGSVMFERGDLKEKAGRFFQDALWLLGPSSAERFQQIHSVRLPKTGRAFPAGGYYILESPEFHCIADAGEIGMHGWGGHGHNDTLSFELTACGQPFITDSGTYAYTGDPEAQVAFAASSAHNTLVVDSTELAEWQGMWRLLRDNTRPKVLQWETSEARQLLVAEHYGYTRLESPVVHRRTFELMAPARTLSIRDYVYGTGNHQYTIFLHFAPDVEIQQTTPRHVTLIGRTAVVDCQTDVDLILLDAWYAPHYGVRKPTRAACMRIAGPVPVNVTTVFAVRPTA